MKNSLHTNTFALNYVYLKSHPKQSMHLNGLKNHGTSWRRCNSDEFWPAVVLLHAGNMNGAVPGKHKGVFLFFWKTNLSNQSAHVNK